MTGSKPQLQVESSSQPSCIIVVRSAVLGVGFESFSMPRLLVVFRFVWAAWVALSMVAPRQVVVVQIIACCMDYARRLTLLAATP